MTSLYATTHNAHRDYDDGRAPIAPSFCIANLMNGRPKDYPSSVTIPPEISGNILEQMPATQQGGRPTLMVCVLVATR